MPSYKTSIWQQKGEFRSPSGLPKNILEKPHAVTTRQLPLG
ncbi:hypothetical protein CAter282_1804 [Collimonas arenae]|uniref:Uncharacterized protein n=1 Tax=Collimonas arenae TaxID=279058 RepID=A0A127QHN0_9BURK|nr:hypothetical protein CAter10_1943 [Collimonas arenae]AMP09580.1 hypothetical protein CAter282_1804 [Collimonas arenae]